MELDKRIIEGRRPLTCFDTENTELIKTFLNKEGYFSNDLENFCSLNKCPKRFLSNVFKESKYSFRAYVEGCDGGYWKFFLPSEWVKEENRRKKYRSYKDYDELCEDFSVGQCITYRDKGCNCIYYAEITEAFVHADGDVFVGIGNTVRALSGWFQTIEVKDPETDEWVPFGVRDEDS